MAIKSVHYVVADDKFLCTKLGDIAALSVVDIESLNLQSALVLNVKNESDAEWFVISASHFDHEDYQWFSLRHLAESVSAEQFQAAGRALQIVRWHFDHQFCGRCGKPTEPHISDSAKVCKSCNLDFYPRLSPCIITLVTRGDECLLAWHARSKVEKYSCLAGFIEVGESPEQTLEREVIEEVGVRVNNIRYVESQPWPFPGQLMLGYFAEYAGGEINVDKVEIVAAKWFRYDDLPTIPPASTISGRLIRTFVRERELIRLNNEPKV